MNKKIKSLDKINKLIHEPARLTIMSHLFVVEQAHFLFMMVTNPTTQSSC